MFCWYFVMPLLPSWLNSLPPGHNMSQNQTPKMYFQWFWYREIRELNILHITIKTVNYNLCRTETKKPWFYLSLSLSQVYQLCIVYGHDHISVDITACIIGPRHIWLGLKSDRNGPLIPFDPLRFQKRNQGPHFHPHYCK